MALLKIKELRQKSTEELLNLLKEYKEELLKIETERRLKKQLSNPGLKRNLKVLIARIKTILNERKNSH
ncbi:MAG TPA: 50S ribosomal protein L29 [Nautiliaceae bacterium]|nr:50S ribosomal protein L29 [Nautiliaceae bacterium]